MKNNLAVRVALFACCKYRIPEPRGKVLDKLRRI